jgi:hypothetical protein
MPPWRPEGYTVEPLAEIVRDLIDASPLHQRDLAGREHEIQAVIGCGKQRRTSGRRCPGSDLAACSGAPPRRPVTLGIDEARPRLVPCGVFVAARWTGLRRAFATSGSADAVRTLATI